MNVRALRAARGTLGRNIPTEVEALQDTFRELLPFGMEVATAHVARLAVTVPWSPGLKIRSTRIIDISYWYFGLVFGCIDVYLWK